LEVNTKSTSTQIDLILDAVKAILLEVDGISNVSTEFFAPRTFEEVANAFKQAKQSDKQEICFWRVSSVGIEETYTLPGFASALDSAFLNHLIQVTGFVSGRTVAESHSKIVDLTSKVMRKLLEERTLRGTCLYRSPASASPPVHETIGAMRLASSTISFGAAEQIRGLAIR